jgi:hypothetical protein
MSVYVTGIHDASAVIDLTSYIPWGNTVVPENIINRNLMSSAEEISSTVRSTNSDLELERSVAKT